jgi:hypothetical protein
MTTPGGAIVVGDDTAGDQPGQLKGLGVLPQFGFLPADVFGIDILFYITEKNGKRERLGSQLSAKPG